MIRILGSELNLTHKALEIYVAGCTRNCPGCHNPESHSFAGGQRFDKWLTANRHKFANPLIEHVWVMGGDLLCQPEQALVTEFLSTLRRALPEGVKLWLWTGATEEELPRGFIPNIYPAHLDVLKLGPYRRDLPSKEVPSPAGTLTLASENQCLMWSQPEIPA